ARLVDVARRPEEHPQDRDALQDREPRPDLVLAAVDEPTEHHGLAVPGEELRLGDPGADHGRIELRLRRGAADLLGDREVDVALLVDRRQDREDGPDVAVLDDLVADHLRGGGRARDLDEGAFRPDEDPGLAVVLRHDDRPREDMDIAGRGEGLERGADIDLAGPLDAYREVFGRRRAVGPRAGADPE